VEELLIYLLALFGAIVIVAICYRTVADIFTTKNYQFRKRKKSKMQYSSEIHWESENRLFAGHAYLGRVMPRYVAPSFIFAQDGYYDTNCWEYCTGAVDSDWVSGFRTVEEARDALMRAVLETEYVRTAGYD
jgi:hypothetical protein